MTILYTLKHFYNLLGPLGYRFAPLVMSSGYGPAFTIRKSNFVSRFIGFNKLGEGESPVPDAPPKLIIYRIFSNFTLLVLVY